MAQSQRGFGACFLAKGRVAAVGIARVSSWVSRWWGSNLNFYTHIQTKRTQNSQNLCWALQNKVRESFERTSRVFAMNSLRCDSEWSNSDITHTPVATFHGLRNHDSPISRHEINAQVFVWTHNWHNWLKNTWKITSVRLNMKTHKCLSGQCTILRPLLLSRT